MNKQSTIPCSVCGADLSIAQSQQDSDKCSKCGAVQNFVQPAFNHLPKSGPMSHRQLVLLMVLLPLLVVAMTVGSWYLIKMTRMPSSEFFGSKQVVIESKGLSPADQAVIADSSLS